MSNEPPPDLLEFYEALDPEAEDGDWGDEDEDGDYEYYVDADEIDEEDMDLEEDEDGEYAEGAEIGEADQDMGQATLVNDPNVVITGEDDESGTTFLNLASLLNQSGVNGDARTSLLQRLLAGPAAGTRGGAGLLRRIAQGAGGAAPVSEEERRRAAEERRRKDRWWEPQSEPNPRGAELLRSGEFGRVGGWRSPGRRVRTRVVQPRRRERVPVPAQVGHSSQQV